VFARRQGGGPRWLSHPATHSPGTDRLDHQQRCRVTPAALGSPPGVGRLVNRFRQRVQGPPGQTPRRGPTLSSPREGNRGARSPCGAAGSAAHDRRIPAREGVRNVGTGSLVGTVRGGVDVTATSAASGPGRPAAQPPGPAPCSSTSASAAAAAARSGPMGHHLRPPPTAVDPAAVHPRAAASQPIGPASARLRTCHHRPDRHRQRRQAPGRPNRPRRPARCQLPAAHRRQAAHGPPPEEAGTLTPGALRLLVNNDRTRWAVPFSEPRERSSVTLPYQRLLALPHADPPNRPAVTRLRRCPSAVAAEKCLRGSHTLPLPDLVSRALPGPRPTPGRERAPLQ